MKSLLLNSSFIKTDMKILFLEFGEKVLFCCFTVWKAKYVGGLLIKPKLTSTQQTTAQSTTTCFPVEEPACSTCEPS